MFGIRVLSQSGVHGVRLHSAGELIAVRLTVHDEQEGEFMPAEQEQLWAAVNAIYQGFLAGDRAAIDVNISPDATVWDSSHERLLRGKDELDAVRDARRPGDVSPSSLDAIDPVIDVFGDIGLVRHVLVASFPPESGKPPLRIRNTSVWRKSGGRWLCLHNHEDVLG
jgi:ketosteroid isomerase-like protein